MNSTEYNTQCPVCHPGLLYGYNRVQQLAIEIAHLTNNHLLADGFAIAYIYIATILLGFNLPQDFPNPTSISEVIIRNRCKEILASYRIRIKVKPVIAEVGR